MVRAGERERILERDRAGRGGRRFAAQKQADQDH